MRCTEVKATTTLAAVRVITADVTEPTIDLFIALRMIANGRHAVTNVTAPVVVISY
jgi:hypothetical protein